MNNQIHNRFGVLGVDAIKEKDLDIFGMRTATRNIIVILDSSCDFICLYCYISKSFRSISKVLNYQSTIQAIVNAIQSFPVINIEFSGRLKQHKEFLQGVFSLKRRYQDKQFHFFFQLNGSELDDSIIEMIKVNRVVVGISSDGTCRVNNAIRKSKIGGYGGAIIGEAIQLLSDNAIPFSIRCTISKANVNDVGALISVFLKNNPSSVFLNRLIYKSDSLIDYSELMVGIDDYLKFYDEYHEQVMSLGYYQFIDVNFRRWLYRFDDNSKGWSHACSTGRCSYCDVITPNGNYKCPKFLGSPVVPENDIVRYREYHCKTCRVSELCKGGCPLGNNYCDYGLSDECVFINHLYDYYLSNKEKLNKIIK